MINPKLDIRHLRVLVAVAEHGGVTKASRQLHLTQSALSHQLRDAEEKLGQRLFERLQKRMVLTPAGEKLLTAAQRALQELSHAEHDLDAMRRGVTGTIRLSTECSTCYHWLPSVLRRLQQDFPRVQIRLFPEDTRFPLTGLMEGRLDVAIISSEPQQEELRVEPLFEDEMVVLMSSAHRLARRRSIQAADLDGERIIVYPPQRDSFLLQKVMLPAGARPSDVVEMPLTEAIVELVRDGFGIALLARWSAAQHLKAGGLRAKNIGLRRRWSAATRHGQELPPYTTELLRLLKVNGMPMRYVAQA